MSSYMHIMCHQESIISRSTAAGGSPHTGIYCVTLSSALSGPYVDRLVWMGHPSRCLSRAWPCDIAAWSIFARSVHDVCAVCSKACAWSMAAQD